MKKYIALVVLVAIVAAGVYAYKIYTDKVESLEDAKADATVTATELIAAFEKDSATANRLYLGKVIAVSGIIKDIEQESGSVVLGNEGSMSSVRCSVDSNFVKSIVTLNQGSQITIKGFCTGYNADDLGLGSDVVLNRCVVPGNQK